MFDEAKLTAYALGELSTEETKQVEGWLERDPSLNLVVVEVRETAATLEASFVSEVGAGLHAAQREAVLAQAAPAITPTRSWSTGRTWTQFAAAAGVLGAIGLAVFAPPARDADEFVAGGVTNENDLALLDPSGLPLMVREREETLVRFTAVDQELGLGKEGTIKANSTWNCDALPTEFEMATIQPDLETKASGAFYDEGFDGDIRGRIEDLYAGPVPPAGWGEGRLQAKFEFDGTGGPGGDTAVDENLALSVTAPHHQLIEQIKLGLVAPDVLYVGRSGQTPGLTVLDLSGFGAAPGDPNFLAWGAQRHENFGEQIETLALRLAAVAPSNGPVLGGKLRTLYEATDNYAGFVAAVEADPELGEPVAHYLYSLYSGLALNDEVPVRVRINLDDVPVPGTESYQKLVENSFTKAKGAPLSTLSVDVDTASYTNVRRFLTDGQLPPADAVRLEEMVNYFRYDDVAPDHNSEHPFSVTTEVGACPWNPEHRLLRVGLQGALPVDDTRPRCNLVFLLDVSGSMDEANKLPLLKDSLRLLVQNLTENDSVSIVTYAGQAQLHMERTHGENREALNAAIDRLAAEGSTNGESGIELAYKLAEEGFIEGGVNRVLLATDGDFNVGQSSDDAMEQLIVEKAKTGVHLSVLGYGTGNLKDSKLETLSGKGNGNYAYIDSLREAKRVLVDELASTLETIAKDVKLQVDFNPSQVASYRLLGYENRALAAQDFQDDTKDAGEIGAGHHVTALYEIVPALPTTLEGVEPSKYQAPPAQVDATVIDSGELCEVRLRYKAPDGDESTEFRVAVTDEGTSFEDLSDDSRFAAAVAGFGMILRGSPHRGHASLDLVASWALSALGEDYGGYRTELCDLIGRARQLGLR